MSADALLAKLDGVLGKGPRWRAICPAHPSKRQTRSLSVYEPDPGRVLIHCHAGCDVESIVAAVGMDLSDLFPTREDDDHRKPRINKPWRVSDVVAALRRELSVMFVVASDVATGVPIGDDERQRAGLAMERIAALLDELDHAH